MFAAHDHVSVRRNCEVERAEIAFQRLHVERSLQSSVGVAGGLRPVPEKGDAGVAAVVDPKFEIDDYLRLARFMGVSIEHILETHNHADHVSGHGRLAAATATLVQRVTDHHRLRAVALRAAETVRPSQAHEVSPASLLCRESSFELLNSTRIIFHTGSLHVVAG